MDLFLSRKSPQELIITVFIRNQSFSEYNICSSNILSDQNGRWTYNPYDKAAKLEQIRDLMQNPSPIGWQRAADLNMIDFCEWDNAKEQENDLPRFIHANFELISMFSYSIFFNGKMLFQTTKLKKN